MVKLSIVIVTNFIHHAVQCAAHPPDDTKLLGVVGTAVDDVVGIEEDLNFLEADTALGIRSEQLAFLGIEIEPPWYNSYIMLCWFVSWDSPVR